MVSNQGYWLDISFANVVSSSTKFYFLKQNKTGKNHFKSFSLSKFSSFS